MAKQSISAGQIATDSGPYFEVGATPSGEALRHPNRVHVGSGYLHNNGLDGSVTGGSWLQSFAASGLVNPVVGWDYFEDIGRVVSTSTFGAAVTGASQATGDVDGIGVIGAVINADATYQRFAWAGYFDAMKTAAGAGNVVGIEVNAANLPGVSPRGATTNGLTTPYDPFVDGMVGALVVASGSDATVVGASYWADYLIEFRNNGAAAKTGLNFRYDSLAREGETDNRSATGNAGYARAISLANDHGLSWYSRDPSGGVGTGTQEESMRMWGSINNPAVRLGFNFNDAGFTFRDRVSPGGVLFFVAYRDDADAYLEVAAAAIGGGPTLSAKGTNANISVRVVPKGSGSLGLPLANIQDFANDAAAAAGGISVGDFYRTSNDVKVRIV